ncbi:MAG: hypothetical protein HYY04_06465 [Chloroflexi bacterium]|nr:hypothetical protein [Chloroflexota bacterium]
MPVKTTIYLDEELLGRVRRLLPSRGLNRFINEALAEKVDALERQQIEQAMREGYLASQRERADLDRDWEAVDVEGWPA